MLALEVIQERVYDPQLFIRKLVLENIAQLDLNQIRMSNKVKEGKLIDIIFESLRDEASEIRKLALTILSQILVKYSQKDLGDRGDLLESHFRKQKL